MEELACRVEDLTLEILFHHCILNDTRTRRRSAFGNGHAACSLCESMLAFDVTTCPLDASLLCSSLALALISD